MEKLLEESPPVNENDSDTEAALPDGIMPIKYQEAEELAAQCLSATNFADEDTETDGEENSEWEGSDEVWAMATTQQLYNSLLLLLLLLLGWNLILDLIYESVICEANYLVANFSMNIDFLFWSVYRMLRFRIITNDYK